jgi:hypothetical protein
MLSPSIVSSSLDVELLKVVAKQLVALGPLTPSLSVKLFGDEEGMMGHWGEGRKGIPLKSWENIVQIAQRTKGCDRTRRCLN